MMDMGFSESQGLKMKAIARDMPVPAVQYITEESGEVRGLTERYARLIEGLLS